MRFVIKCFRLFMNLVYSWLKLFKVKNKVTFISRQSDETNIDFKLLIEEIKKQNPKIEIVVLTKKLNKGFLSKVKYIFHMFRQMYHIATSKTIILDSYCIMISVLKHRKNLKIIQIWHAMGSLKKFGYSALDKSDGRNSNIAKLMSMHKNYTYILTSSEVSKPFFMEAFNASEEQMKVMSLPRVDFLQSKTAIEETKKEFYKLYPEMNNEKKNILYCPTQRKNNEDRVEDVVKAVNFNRYNLIIKLHDGREYVYVLNRRIERVTKFTGMELLHIADYIITDYSAIVYEAAIVEKPIYFYVYDYDTYIKDRGWYIDYIKEMPGAIEKDINNILKLIEEKKWDKDKVIKFKEKYIQNLSGDSTKRLTKLILE